MEVVIRGPTLIRMITAKILVTEIPENGNRSEFQCRARITTQ